MIKGRMIGRTPEGEAETTEVCHAFYVGFNKAMNLDTPEIEYTCSYSGGSYVTTDLELKGRGIKLAGDGSDHK